jgi:hypothetical protein
MAFALTIASAVASIDGLVTITADSLRRLVRAGSVPTQVLRRRQARGAPYTLPWEGVLPDLAEWRILFIERMKAANSHLKK